MFNTSAFVQIYLDTSAILRFSKLEEPDNLEGPDNPVREVLVALHNLQKEGMVTIFTAQGSLIDMFGENDEKIIIDRKKIAALDREKTRMMQTLPLATSILESNDDFDENDIELFNIMFNAKATKTNIYYEYSNLAENDRTDYTILRDFILDSNNISYFLTRNSKHFINGGKKERIEEYLATDRNPLKIRDVSQNTLQEIRKDIEDL